MRIAKIEDLHADGGWRTFDFLKITTDDGLVGWAEYAEGFGAGGVTQLIHRMAPIVTGMDPRAVGRISATLHAMTRLAAGGLNNQAIAAIENACLDIKARAAGVPVHALFGGPYREKVPVYWSHFGSFRIRFADLFEKEWGRPPIRTADDLKALAREAVARGFRAVKTNPLFLDGPVPRMFDPGFRPSPTLLERNASGALVGAIEETLGIFRDGLGPRIGLMLDLNFSQRTEGLLRIARAAEPFRLDWLEADMHDPEALATVRRGTATPIASLESVHGLKGYRPYLQHQAVDVAVIDVPWNGLLESVRIATLADAFEVNIAPHNFYGHLSTLMSAHLCAAVPNVRILELEVDDVPWKDALVTRPPVVEDGALLVPDGPGWGCEVDEAALRAHPPRRR